MTFETLPDPMVRAAQSETVRAFLSILHSEEGGGVLHFDSTRERLTAYNTIWVYCKRNNIKAKMKGRKNDLYISREA